MTTSIITNENVVSLFIENKLQEKIGCDPSGRVVVAGSANSSSSSATLEPGKICDYLQEHIAEIGVADLSRLHMILAVSPNKAASEMLDAIVTAQLNKKQPAMASSVAVPIGTNTVRVGSVVENSTVTPVSSVTNTQKALIVTPTSETPVYAKRSFINGQRLLGLGSMVAGLLASVLAPVLGAALPALSALSALALPLFVIGGIVIGASLIQQVIGNAPGCEAGRGKRAVAGVAIMFFGPLGWIVGGVLWYLSAQENKPIV